MATYVFRCDDCGFEEEVVCKMSELDQVKDLPCSECGGHREQVIGSPTFGDAIRLGIRKPDDGFREQLSRIHETMPGSHLNERLSRN